MLDLLGPAGSGKSTAARQLNLPVVSSDSCRAEITGGDPYDQTATPDAVRLMHTLLAVSIAEATLIVVTGVFIALHTDLVKPTLLPWQI
ncbi:MAG: AAA family ATPase [Kibdelosporangium sp.]